MMTAFRRRKADHVPACPDISVMVPAKLTGRPFHELFLDGREHNGWTSATYSEAYVEAVKYFGMDGWYIYGGLKEIKPEGRPDFVESVVDHPEGKMAVRVCKTSLGDLTEEELYFNDNAPWREVKPIKNLRQDWEKFKLFMGTGDWKWEPVFKDYNRIGDLGVYVAMIPVFQDWWFHYRHGGFEQCFADFLDEPEFMEGVHAFWMEWALASVRAMAAAGPDEIMLGGSSASLSVSSPSIFKKYELPFIKAASKITKEAGVISHLHICGKSWPLVEIVANDTDVDVMEPLEEPPGGNVDIAMVKRRFGSKLCLKGNINTFNFMMTATPQQVEDKCKKLIDEAGYDGGFVLSTGDQCGRDTPHANLFKMVEVAKTYGKY